MFKAQCSRQMLLAVNDSIWKTSDKGRFLMQGVSSDAIAQSTVLQQKQEKL